MAMGLEIAGWLFGATALLLAMHAGKHGMPSHWTGTGWALMIAACICGGLDSGVHEIKGRLAAPTADTQGEKR